MKVFSNKFQAGVFICIVMLITLPLLIPTLKGSIKNEAHLVLFWPVIMELPWNVIFLILPFDIPGVSSKSIPDPSGGYILTVGQLFCYLIPVYFNIFLFVRAFLKEPKLRQYKIKKE